MQRSPESLERQREREKLRRREARRRQLNWRRKYGDLAPSRQSRSMDRRDRSSNENDGSMRR